MPRNSIFKFFLPSTSPPESRLTSPVNSPMTSPVNSPVNSPMPSPQSLNRTNSMIDFSEPAVFVTERSTGPPIKFSLNPNSHPRRPSMQRSGSKDKLKHLFPDKISEIPFKE